MVFQSSHLDDLNKDITEEIAASLLDIILWLVRRNFPERKNGTTQ